jgi:hypothetical protein
MLTFNVALDKVIGDAIIRTRRTIFYKSVQLLAYAYDIDINGRPEHDINKSFVVIKTATDVTIFGPKTDTLMEHWSKFFFFFYGATAHIEP